MRNTKFYLENNKDENGYQVTLYESLKKEFFSHVPIHQQNTKQLCEGFIKVIESYNSNPLVRRMMNDDLKLHEAKNLSLEYLTLLSPSVNINKTASYNELKYINDVYIFSIKELDERLIN